MGKSEQLLALAKLRQSKVYEGYKNVGDYGDGAYECDHVSPYTKVADNLNAKVMFFLQDWSSDEALRGAVDRDSAELGYSPGLATNENLKRLLGNHFGLSLSDTYGTNLFPYIKMGNMSATIPIRDLTAAAIEFASPQMEIVSPNLVICLGERVFTAIRRGLGLDSLGNLAAAIASPFNHGSVRIWAQSHPGKLGRVNRNRGGIDRVSADWSKMANDQLLQAT